MIGDEIRTYKNGNQFFDETHEYVAMAQGYLDADLAFNRDTGVMVVCNRCNHVVFNEKKPDDLHYYCVVCHQTKDGDLDTRMEIMQV